MSEEQRIADRRQDTIVVSELEKGLLDVTHQVGSLVSVTAKLENTVEQIGDAMQILARKEVVVEQHADAIKKLEIKTDENTKNIQDIAIDIHGRCDIKELHNAKEEIEDKLEVYVKDLYTFNWKILGTMMSALIIACTIIFSYILLNKQEHEKTNDSVVGSLDKMYITITKMDKSVSNMIIKQDYMEQKMKEKHTHE